MPTFAQSCLFLSGLALVASPVPPNVQVRVTCPVDVACPGMKVVFRATVQGAPTGVCRWTATGGSLEPSFAFTGTATAFQVPVVTGFEVFTVRATSVHDDKAGAEGSILAWGGPVMLSGVTELINAYARPVTWATPCALGGRPFLDPETGAPFPGCAGAPARPDPLNSPWLPDQMVGYGRPARLQVGGAQGGSHLLSLRTLEGGWEYRAGTAGQPALIHAKGSSPAGTVETLGDAPAAGAGSLASTFHRVRLPVRGMVPLAGHPALTPGDADGRGLGARFREPGGPALLTGLKDHPDLCVVPDRQGHVLRTVTADGEARTLCGCPGEAGFRDGAGAEARFHRPAYAAAHPAQDGDWAFRAPIVVADAGNHAIRLVDAAGQVTTLARNGKPGYLDTDRAADATFNDPQGVAVDPQGNVFVADRGNQVIRKITPSGQVLTLAGSGKAGTADGLGTAASFTDLKGLTLRHPYDGRLYVVDGHAVRQVSAQGRVDTLLGQVRVPGHAVFPFSDGTLRWPLTQAPCLRDPQGLTCRDSLIYLADTGNHAVRCFFGRETRPQRVGVGFLLDLAGHPEDCGHRWGLLQDGLPWQRTPDYAALDAPRGLALTASGDAWLATGSCLANLSRLNHTQVRIDPHLRVPGGSHCHGRALRRLTAKAGQDLVLTLPLGEHTALAGVVRPFDWCLEILDPLTQQAIAKPWPGRHDGNGNQLRLAAGDPGALELRIKCVLDDGVTEFFWYHVTIEP